MKARLRAYLLVVRDRISTVEVHLDRDAAHAECDRLAAENAWMRARLHDETRRCARLAAENLELQQELRRRVCAPIVSPN